jgi:hypothetical protein
MALDVGHLFTGNAHATPERFTQLVRDRVDVAFDYDTSIDDHGNAGTGGGCVP